MPKPSIQPVSPDTKELLSIWRSSVEAIHHFLTPAQVDQLVPFVRQAFLQMEQLLGIWDLQGQLSGFLGVCADRVEMLFIDAAHRGQGLGGQLLQYAIDRFDVRHLDVNEQNPQALGFYQRFGFQVYARSALDGQGNPFPLLHLER